MGIQNAINQGISVASLLYTQTPGYQAKVAEKTEQKRIETNNKMLEKSIENKKAIAKEERKGLKKEFDKSRDLNETVSISEKHLKVMEKLSEEELSLYKQKAELTGAQEDVKAYVKKRIAMEKHFNDIKEFIGLSKNYIALRDKAQESQIEAQQQKRESKKAKQAKQEYYIGKERITDPGLIKKIEEAQKTQAKGGNKQ